MPWVATNMRVDDYTYVREFENFCLRLEATCRAHFGKPDKLIIDTNIYLFLFEKDKFRLCIDSSESYCFPKDPDIYFRLIYQSPDGLIFIDELPAVNIRYCLSINKECTQLIKKAARVTNRSKILATTIASTKALVLFGMFYVLGTALKISKLIKNSLKE